jgi:opacity protein-like surface antigen
MPRRLLPLLVLLLSAPALAESAEPDYSRPGVYIGVEGLVGVETRYELDGDITILAIDGRPPDPEVLPYDDQRVDAAFGVNGRIGYRLHPRVAVEGEFEWINGFDVKGFNDVKITDGEGWFASANVKGYLLTDRRFQPFLLAGVGYYRAKLSSFIAGSVINADGPDSNFRVPLSEESNGGVALRVGLGLEAYITEHVAFIFDAQYVRPFVNVEVRDYSSGEYFGYGEIEGLDYVSIGVGLQYRF